VSPPLPLWGNTKQSQNIFGKKKKWIASSKIQLILTPQMKRWPPTNAAHRSDPPHPSPWARRERQFLRAVRSALEYPKASRSTSTAAMGRWTQRGGGLQLPSPPPQCPRSPRPPDGVKPLGLNSAFEFYRPISKTSSLFSHNAPWCMLLLAGMIIGAMFEWQSSTASGAWPKGAANPRRAEWTDAGFMGSPKRRGGKSAQNETSSGERKKNQPPPAQSARETTARDNAGSITPLPPPHHRPRGCHPPTPPPWPRASKAHRIAAGRRAACGGVPRPGKAPRGFLPGRPGGVGIPVARHRIIFIVVVTHCVVVFCV